MRRLGDATFFPTRRSSDLALAKEDGGCVFGYYSYVCATETSTNWPLFSAGLAMSVGGTILWVMGDHRERDAQAPDRKSTRLNSSHLGIAYAVLCLRKKIIAVRTCREIAALLRAGACHHQPSACMARPAATKRAATAAKATSEQSWLTSRRALPTQP